MEIRTLVDELNSQNPNLLTIHDILSTHTDLLHGILEYGASALHIAIRNDVLNGTHLTELLLSKYQINPNITNDCGSTPFLWALAAWEESIIIGKQPYSHSIYSLISHKDFKINKSLLYRGNTAEFVKKYFHSTGSQHFLSEATWKSALGFIYAKESIGEINLL